LQEIFREQSKQIPRLPGADPHPIFTTNSIAEINRLRSQEFDTSCSKDTAYILQQIKLDLYFNVQDIVEQRVVPEEAFERIFRLLDIYAKFKTS
jgi:hypothetical protein